MSTFKFKGINKIGEISFLETQQIFLKQWIDWCLIQSGGYFNISYNKNGPYGQNFSKLTLSNTPNYTSGRVWDCFRHDLIHEERTGLSPEPKVPVEVKVNGVNYATNVTGAFAYKINLPLGQVIFDTAINKTSEVLLEYSYRYFTVYKADDLLAFNNIITSGFNQTSKGEIYKYLAEQKIQLPCIIIEDSKRTKHVPYQLGGGQYYYRDYLFHILAENESDIKRIDTIFTFQKDSSLIMPNYNTIYSSGKMPLNEYGYINSSGLNFKESVEQHPYLRLFIKDVTSSDIYSKGIIKRSVVRITTETVLECI